MSKATKRCLLMLVLICMFLLTAASGLAYENRVASGSCGAEGSDVSWILDTNGTLTIYGAGAIANYDQGNPPWYDYRDSIKQLVMSDSITVIGKRAFANCTNLSEGYAIESTAAMPMLIVTQPGCIPTTSAHEYSTDGASWTRCTGELTGLAAGTYYVRVAATDTMLASPAQIVTVDQGAAAGTRKLVSLTANADSYQLGDTITVTAAFEGDGEIEAMEYHVYNSQGQQVTGYSGISASYTFTPSAADTYTLRAYMKPVGGEWHSVDCKPVTVVDPNAGQPSDDPLKLIEFYTDVAELNIFEQINFILRYEGSDYSKVKQMLFYTYDGRGQQIGDPWTYDGFIGHYGFISSAAGSYAIRVFMLMEDGSMQMVTSPFFLVIDPNAPPIEPLVLTGFTTDTSELKVGEQIDFLLTYTGNDTYSVGRMLFYTYDGDGNQLGDPWTYDGFIGHYGFISSIPGYYAIRTFMLTNDGNMQVVTSPFFMVYANTSEDETVSEPTAEPTAEPTVEPTAEPTVEPTVEPTAEPTAEPTVEPTAEPTVEPTVEPTAEPTVEPTVEPVIEYSAYVNVPAGEIYSDRDCTEVLGILNRDGIALVSSFDEGLCKIHFDIAETEDEEDYLTGYVRIENAQFLTVDQAAELEGTVKNDLLITLMDVTLAVKPEPEVTAVPEVEDAVEPTVEPEVEPTVEPEVEATVEPTVEPEVEATVEPTVEPEVEATVEPTVEPEAEAVVEPAAEPEAEAVVEPAAEPEEEAVAEPAAETTEETAQEPVTEAVIEAEEEPADETPAEPVIEEVQEPENETAAETAELEADAETVVE